MTIAARVGDMTARPRGALWTTPWLCAQFHPTHLLTDLTEYTYWEFKAANEGRQVPKRGNYGGLPL
jgi:hypothetical protein